MIVILMNVIWMRRAEAMQGFGVKLDDWNGADMCVWPLYKRRQCSVLQY